MEISILGAVERAEDKRDIELGAVQVPQPRPAVFLEDVSALPTYFQGRQPACGPHAGAWFKARKDTRDTGAVADYSPNFGWIKIKEFDGYPLEVGTDMRSIFKWLRDVGACDFSLLGNHVNRTLQDYAAPSQVTPQMLENAKTKKIAANYAFLTNLSFDAVCDAIWQNKEILILARVGDDWFVSTTPTFTNPYSGHFFVGFGYDKDYVYIKDSTAKDPKLSVKKIHRKFFKPEIIREAGTAINLPPLVVKVATNRNDIIRELIRLWTLYLNLRFPQKV